MLRLRKRFNFMEQKAEWFHERRLKARETHHDLSILDIEEDFQRVDREELGGTEMERKIAAYAYFAGRMDELHKQHRKNNAMKELFTTPLATISIIQSKVEEIAWGFTAGMDVKKGQDELAKLISYMDKETKRLGEERDNGQFIKDFKPSELRFIYDFVKKADESGIDFSGMTVYEFYEAADNIINQLKEK